MPKSEVDDWPQFPLRTVERKVLYFRRLPAVKVNARNIFTPPAKRRLQSELYPFFREYILLNPVVL